MAASFGTALRPVNPLHRHVYLRFYHAASRQNCPAETGKEILWASGNYKQRLRELKAHRPVNESSSAFPSSLYPRLTSLSNVTIGYKRLTVAQFRQAFGYLETNVKIETSVTIYGKVKAVRDHKNLVFVDIVQEDALLQVMVNLGYMKKKGSFSDTQLDSFRKKIEQGDYYQFFGEAGRSSTGELSLSVLDVLPESLAPSLHDLPQEITDEETLARFPQLDLLTRPKKRDFIRLRHYIGRGLSKYLDQRGYIKVTTPILAADTDGAAARPFETVANEFSATPLKLRIAQELALKKLVAADLGSVYEIGPNFRNEGVDATHNPEFTTCEFYRPYMTLEKLMRQTEDMLSALYLDCAKEKLQMSFIEHDLVKLQPYFLLQGNDHYRRLPFLPTLMERIHPIDPTFRLPKVLSDETAPQLIPLFERFHVTVPAHPTMARLLDALCSHFIEPLCQEPTFIYEHPAIMSPLAKSFTDPESGHEVSARAELFIKGIEYVNMYEEENNPFLQAKKFFLQSLSERGGKPLNLESLGMDPVLEFEAIKKRLTPGQRYFLRVLEMGLPPTGGWGCGVDRLVMLFGGAKRIHDVLPFGNMRNVIAMGTDPGSELSAKSAGEDVPVDV